MILISFHHSFPYLNPPLLWVTLLRHPLGEGVRRCSTNDSGTGSQSLAEHAADLFIKEVRPAFIPPPKVLLAQAADSAVLSFSHWCLRVRCLFVNSLWGRTGLVQGGSAYHTCSCRLAWAPEPWVVWPKFPLGYLK